MNKRKHLLLYVCGAGFLVTLVFMFRVDPWTFFHPWGAFVLASLLFVFLVVFMLVLREVLENGSKSVSRS